MKAIIVSPSLNPEENVSGISAVTQFIISNNSKVEYLHFELGRKDKEKGGIFRIKSIVSRLLAWKRLLKQNRDAVVHYNFPLSKPSILRDPLFMYIARKKGMKMVIHIHGGNFLTAVHTPNYLERILRKVFSWNYPIVVLSELEKELINNKYACRKIEILPNCVDLSGASAFQRKEKKDHEPLVMGYLGRIAETKGMGYLLNACKELKSQGIPFILKIAGKEEVENRYLPLFEKELGNRFVYEGVVYGKTKDDFLKSLDVFMLPSYFEGLPMSLLECMGFGVVPITTNVGSIKEVVDDHRNGLFVQVKDVETIVSQIVCLHENRLFLNRLSDAAKSTIFNMFSPSAYVKKLNDIYSSL